VAAVLAEVYGVEPYQSRTGGSIPVCELFLDTLGVYTVGFAFGLRDEQIHAPDEFFRLNSFRRGQQAYARLLHELGHLSIQ
jgi:acetylornithine deacetylase/succinyl-diaminopimelate desuccinylase-like protein